MKREQKIIPAYTTYEDEEYNNLAFIIIIIMIGSTALGGPWPS